MLMSSPGLMHPSQSPHQGNTHPAMMAGMGSPHQGPGTAGHPPPPPGAIPSGGVPLSMAANLPHTSPHQLQQQQQQQQEKDGKKEGEQMSAMPLPPEQYIKMYSDEHVAMGITPPPPPPIKDNYSMFGQPFSADDTIIQSLESQGIRRLGPAAKDVDRKKELHKLNHSILVNFLDLIDLLIKAPESPKREEKIDDINLLFIHMHHLINEFRPHQARETLRVMLHVQKRKRLQVADKFQANLDKVQETIENALQSLPEQDDASGSGLASLEVPEAMDATSMYRDAETDNCSAIDRIMCGLADEIETTHT